MHCPPLAFEAGADLRRAGVFFYDHEEEFGETLKRQDDEVEAVCQGFGNPELQNRARERKLSFGSFELPHRWLRA